MKKKAAARLKGSSSKKMKHKSLSGNSKTVAATVPAPPPRPTLQDDPRFAQTVQNYEVGVKAMQARKYERAKGFFEKVVASGLRELADRAMVHLNTCNQQSAKTAGSFKSVEEHYDFAISIMNSGDFDEARAHLQKLAKQAAKADFVWYGLAVLDCVTNRYEPALKNLQEAIRLNPANRFQARNDSDFHALADDPRFTELLYPEGGVPAALPMAPTQKSRAKRR